MSIRAKIAAYRDAVADQGATEIRMQLTTEQAIELVGETADAAQRAKAAAESLAELMAAPQPAGIDAALARTQAAALLVSALWDAVEGMDVDGCTVIRKRAI
jgi:hypothetical protein